MWGRCGGDARDAPRRRRRRSHDDSEGGGWVERPATTDGRRRTNNCMKSDLDDDEELGCRLVGAADALALAVDAQLELLRNRRRERALLGLGVVALQKVQVAHSLADDVVRRLAAQRRREQIEQRACTRHTRAADAVVALGRIRTDV